jgi:hypothetical protein
MPMQMVSNLMEEVLSGVTRWSLWPDIQTAALFDFGLTAAVGVWLFFYPEDITGNWGI